MEMITVSKVENGSRAHNEYDVVAAALFSVRLAFGVSSEWKRASMALGQCDHA